MTKEEDLYKELLDLSIKAKEIRQRQKEIKFELLEMKELNELENNSFGNELGKVVIETEVKYELADLLPEVKIPTSVLNETQAKEFIKTKQTLTRYGRKMFKQGIPELQKIMIPIRKTKVNVKLI